jgi:hypothetical protein
VDFILTTDSELAFLWLFTAIFVLAAGLADTRQRAATLRGQLESARTSGERETAQWLAGQLLKKIRNTLFIWAGISLLLLVVGIGFLVEPEATGRLLIWGLAAVWALLIALALIRFSMLLFWNPVRDLARDLRLGRAIRHQADPK